MFPAEVQRIILLVALAATGYLLILAWNEDYIQNAEPTRYSDAPTVSSGSADVPDAAAATPPASDVPDASLIGTQPGESLGKLSAGQS